MRPDVGCRQARWWWFDQGGDNDGETYMAVVSLRAINSGEFFKLEESDDDDSDDDDDDVGGEEAWEEEDGED